MECSTSSNNIKSNEVPLTDSESPIEKRISIEESNEEINYNRGPDSNILSVDCQTRSHKYQEDGSVTESSNALMPSTTEMVTVRCSVCHKLLSNLTYLKEHMRCHTNEKPYYCNIGVCKKAFKWRSSRSAHINSHFREKCGGPGKS